MNPATFLSLTCIAVLAAFAPCVRGGVLFSEDFSSPEPGSAVSTTKWGSGSGFIVRDETTSAAFGATARFGRLSGAGIRRTAQITLPATGVLTFHFDFSEPEGSGGEPLIFGLGRSDEINTANAGLAFSLRDGQLSAAGNTSGPAVAYTLGAAHRITVIFNRSGAPLAYDFNGSNTLPHGSADVWLGDATAPGTATKTGTYTSNANTSAANQFLFRTWSQTPGNTVDVDNVVIHNTLVLPGWNLGDPWRSALYGENWTPPGRDSANFHTDPFLQDFSYAGYRAGNGELPQIAGPEWIVTDAPFSADPTGAADSTAAIQAAIDAAASAGGGVVKLPPGIFRVRPQGDNAHALRIGVSGIVLRGAGAGQTFLFNDATEMRQKHVILVQGPSNASFTHGGSGSSPLISDLLGPATVLPVADAGLFSPGGWVTVRADATEDWIAEHGVGNWSGYGSNLGGFSYRRQVVAVDSAAGTVTIDIPTRYALKTRDNARLVRATHSGIDNIGLEDFSIGMLQRGGTAWGEESYNTTTHTAWHTHGCFAINLQRVRDSWLSGVESYQPAGNSTTAHILSNGVGLDNSCRITLADCHFQRPQYGGGGGNGYMYRLSNSSDCLLIRCRATFSRHGFVFASMRTSGNVLHRCIDKDTGRQTGNTGSQGTSGTGSDHHMHFSHSNLVDACTADASYFIAAYRPYGSAPLHEVTAAHSVFWNTEGLGSGGVVVQSEQSRYGYIIGTRGIRSAISRPTGGGSRMAPADWVEGVAGGGTLDPFSLYESQLLRRLTPHSPSALETWRTAVFGDDAGDESIAGNMADPDRDGLPNILEFAIAGNPLAPARDGKMSARLFDPENGGNLFILTLPVRTGAVFRGPGSLISDPVDGIVYTIQGSADLADFASLNVVEVQPPHSDGMPVLSDGWEYRSFRPEPSVDEAPRAFLRLLVTGVQE